MPKVLIADELSPRAVEIFAARGITADVATGLGAAELQQRIAGYEGLAVRSATKVTAELLAAAPELKVVGRAGVGVDNIDVAAATERGIVVMNTPYGNSITAAEHTIAMMFALARQIPMADRSTQAGKWEKSRFLGVELFGKTLGVIGCGNIGAIVAGRALGLEMKVIAYDPFLSPERARGIGVEKVELNELFARADFITLHTPLNDATRNLIDAAAIARMKRGVRCLCRGARARQCALRSCELYRNAASRRGDGGGAGECRAADRRANGGFPVDRCRLQRGQHALLDSRGGGAAAALHHARGTARELCRAIDRDRYPRRRDRVRRRSRTGESKAADRDGLGGAVVAAAGRGQSCQCSAALHKARHSRCRNAALRPGRLPEPDPCDGDDRAAAAQHCRDCLCREPLAPCRDRGHPARSRAWAPHAVCSQL